MEKKGKKTTRGRKPKIPEEDNKQKESIMEEISNISGKPIEVSVEKDKSPPPARMKRAVKKQTVNTKKSDTAPSSPPTKRKKMDAKEKEKDVNSNEDVKSNETKPCEKGVPVPNLPGWRKEICIRKSGASAGKADVYFYSPAGSKLRSRPEVSAYLKQHKIKDVKIEEFDFGKEIPKVQEVKGIVENSKAKAKTPKNKPVKKRPKPELKPHSAKKSKSEKSANVPSSAEKNDTDGKSNKVLIKILESKPKKSRK